MKGIKNKSESREKGNRMGRTKGRRLHVCLLLIGIVSVTCLNIRSASAFTLTDTDFVGGVYNLSYYGDSNTVVKNGSTIATGIGSLFLTNNAWSGPTSEGSGQYLKAGGSWIHGNPSTTSASATMGWDFSAITGQISSVEITTHNYIFHFAYWISEAAGDTIYANVATPNATFGTGVFSPVYEFTGPNASDYASIPTASGRGTTDLIPFLSSSWLSNPSLLELEIGYNLQNLDIPGKHLQLFRSTSNPGFEMIVTLAEEDPPPGNVVPEPTTFILLGIGIAGFAGAEMRRRRKTREVENS